MLEELLKELTSEIRLLRQAITSTKAPVVVSQPSKSAPEEVVEPTSSADKTAELREKIKAMCLAISKSNREKLPLIKDVFKTMGHPTVDATPEEKLPELLAKVEAIQ